MAIRNSFLALNFRSFDYFLPALVLLVTGLGIFVLDGSTHDVVGLAGYARRQTVWWAVSLGFYLGALLIPYGWLRYAGWPFYGLCAAVLSLLLFMRGGIFESIEAGGAVSWIRLPLGGSGIRIQPSELAKIATAIVLAHWLSFRQGRLTRIWECIIPGMLAGIPIALIFKQPDFGTASVFIPLLLALMLVAGLDWKVIGILAGFFAAVSAFGVYYIMASEDIPGLKKYQQERLQVFLKPLVQPFRPPGVEEVLSGRDTTSKRPPLPQKKGKGQDEVSGDDWNIRQAEMALGSGQIFGKGWRQGTQSRLKFLPEHYTDFIFPSLGEQFGLVGCLGLLLAYLLIAWRCLHIAISSQDSFGRLLVVGLLTLFITHILLNVGMTIRLLPVTGLPLPLMSYGGSFLVTNYILFGLISNVGMRRKES